MECKKLSTTIAASAAVLLGGIIAFADKGGTPQASITLQNCDAKYCYTHDNTWTLTKEVTGNTVTDGVGTVTWTVTATKDSSAAATFTVHGGLTIYNSGTAPATIGNIVVNLQKPNSQKIAGKNVPWVSVAADIADATNGDGATTANIVAAGSQESQPFSAAFGANNYTVSSAKGTFIETAGSGPLNFTDASNNTAFSLNPQPVIPVGQSITLLYDASFSTSVLVAGTGYRVEALVSFGNAGGRSTSGSSATNININGDSGVDSVALDGLPVSHQGNDDGDEANVRTVPCRVTLAPLPAAPAECNDSVTVTDDLVTDITTTGTVTTSNPAGFAVFPAVINTSTSWTVSVDVDSGANGGKVCNDAHLDGAACGGTLGVVVGYDNTDPLNAIPIYATYTCAAAADADDSACADVGPPSGFEPGDFCTVTQGGWGASPHGGNPGELLTTNFGTVYPFGVEVGISGSSGFSMKFGAASTITGTSSGCGGTGHAPCPGYLPAGGPPGVLTADLAAPPTFTSSSSGVFGGQVLALQLNLDFNNAGLLVGTLGSISGLTLCNLTTSDTLDGDTLTAAQVAALNGQTITQVLAEANTVLGGGTGTYGLTFAQLNDLVDALNNAFDGCTEVTAFAQAHLCK